MAGKPAPAGPVKNTEIWRGNDRTQERLDSARGHKKQLLVDSHHRKAKGSPLAPFLSAFQPCASGQRC